jgi:CheY-like chemotaxis protein
MSYVLIEKYGAQVKDVGSGMEAINILSAGERFDIIFLDIMMPRMNGIETYKKLREVRGVACPIVMMSAFSDSKEWKEVKELGVELTPKPISEEMIVSILGGLGNKPS